MMPVISKRKLESYKRAEKVAQQARIECSGNGVHDMTLLSDFVIDWMSTTGKVKYESPIAPKKRYSKRFTANQ